MTDMKKEIEEAARQQADLNFHWKMESIPNKAFQMGYIEGATHYASKLEALKKENEEARRLMGITISLLKYQLQNSWPNHFHEIETYLNRKNDGK